MRTAIFIDGLNFFNGMLKGTPWKWHDPKKICQHILPQACQIEAIFYCTALVIGEEVSARQELHLRAMTAYIPELRIIPGKFTETTKTGVLRGSSPPKLVSVMLREEKRSDVNLAAHLIHESHKDSFDCAAIISNDSDLAEALRIVRDEVKNADGTVGKEVYLLSPVPPGKHIARDLKQNASHPPRRIWRSTLEKCQLPDQVYDPKTRQYITKPDVW